jgi:hypothetical protein
VRSLATVFAAAALAAPAAQARSPQQLLQALLTAKVGASALPHGYRSPLVERYTLTPNARKHHALGGAEIVADGGNEAVIYIVFRNAADARADFAHANTAGASVSAAPNGLPKPSMVVNDSVTGSSNGQKVTFGLTDVIFVSDNVIVQAATTSLQSPKHGDVAGAIALAGFAKAHLRSVQR